MASNTLPGMGLLKGLAVTIKHVGRRPATLMYPHERPYLAPRARGVIALMDENCTVCMLCSRECPDWCIYIESHKETVPAAKEGGRARTRNVLDRFAIDFSLCMYCGICVEVCPFDALWWSPEFEYSEYSLDALLHEKERLRAWADTVPPPPQLDTGALPPAEIVDAIEKARKDQTLPAPSAAPPVADETKAAPAASADATAADAPAPKAAEIRVEAGEIDQETFDRLIAEGKPERMARAKAKAAYVKKMKAQLAQEAEAGSDAPVAESEESPTETAAEPATADDAPAATAETPAPAPKPEIHVEAGEIDQETFDRLIAEGKPERMARAKAKAAYVKKRRKELEQEGGQ